MVPNVIRGNPGRRHGLAHPNNRISHHDNKMNNEGQFPVIATG